MRICEICRARFKGTPQVCPLDGGRMLDLPDPLLGRNVAGRYLVQQKIGAGGMGSVYRARHEVVGRDVAIKFLAPELAMDPTNRQRFLREARAANRIQHEHIIEITDFGETDDGLVYLVMEFLVGRPLNALIAKGPVRLGRALEIARQIAVALAHAHEFDVVHRDIKPENVYLLPHSDGEFVKLLDFGLAHMKGEMRLTASGTVFGTPEYMAPEQARGAPITPSVDLYALGCVLFEMLTGRIPFTGSTPDMIIKHIREPAPKPSSIHEGIPVEVDVLVQRLMEKSPDKRARDAFSLAEELRQLVARMPAEPSEPGRRRRPSLEPVGETASSPGLTEAALSGLQPASGSWIERVSRFRELLARAHPTGDAPPWLVQLVDHVTQEAAELKAAKAELERIDRDATAQEEHVREVRARIGRALDELVRDESRCNGRLLELAEKLTEARRRLADIDRPLLTAWGAVPVMPAAGPKVTRDVAAALRDAGALASAWVELDRSVSSLERDAGEREREREDLRFQLAQLKGRLGTLHAEADIDGGALRDRARKLDTNVQERSEQLLQRAEQLVAHFERFPHLRALVHELDEAAATRPTVAHQR